MGFFSYLVGSDSKKADGSASVLSIKKEYSLTRDQIKKLVSKYNVRSLDSAEERLIEEAIMDRRRGDGRISLFQINEALCKLKNQYKISDVDRKGVLRVFTDYFEKK